MRAPIVSVVIIFLNAEPFLEEAIQSVSAQTFPDWELILVDDGSTDASARIARRWCEAQPDRIRLLHHAGQANRGMSASRNLGLQHATGEFVAYLDADDVWEPVALEQRVGELQRYPAAVMVFGPALYWWSWSASSQHRDREQSLPVAVDRLHPPPALVAHFLTHAESTPQLGTALFRKTQLLLLGGGDVSFRSMYEDQVLATKVALAHRIFVSSKVVCRYRQHDRSACAVSFADGSHVHDRLRYLEWLKRYMANLRLGNAAIAQVLRQQLRKASAARSGPSPWRRAAARALPASVVAAMRRRLYGDA